MEAARDLTALTCGGAERGPGVELERSHRPPNAVGSACLGTEKLVHRAMRYNLAIGCGHA